MRLGLAAPVELAIAGLACSVDDSLQFPGHHLLFFA